MPPRPIVLRLLVLGASVALAGALVWRAASRPRPVETPAVAVVAAEPAVPLVSDAGPGPAPPPANDPGRMYMGATKAPFLGVVSADPLSDLGALGGLGGLGAPGPDAGVP